MVYWYQQFDTPMVFVHAKKKEEAFFAAGFGIKRYAVMHNDFILQRPANDPAVIKGLNNSIAAFKKIEAAKMPFISRGDGSGTLTKEQSIWAETAISQVENNRKLVLEGKEVQFVLKQPADSAAWYFSIGQGMDETLTFADEKRFLPWLIAIPVSHINTARTGRRTGSTL
jgi:tungstate transport system substrate-binding protein